MVIANLFLDDIYSFDNFNASFVYPKKIVNNPVDGEYLKDYPNFRYKKINVIVGSNATGKTTFGKAIWHVFMFLNKKEAEPLLEIVGDNSREAKIILDYVMFDGILNRADIVISPAKDNGEREIKVRILEVKLNKNDSYESASARFDLNTPYRNYIDALSNVNFSGWNFTFPLTEKNFDKISCPFDGEERYEFLNVLLPLIKTLDSSIKDIKVSNEVDKTYIIIPEKGDSFYISNEMKLSEFNKLSSGTKYGFNIASTLYSIKKHINGFYYIDEQFSYINSDIEIAIFNLMSSYISDGEQLIFTTHNTELLALNYPVHAFNFFRKQEVDGKKRIELIDASIIEKRNNTNIKNLYDNDFFGASPDLSNIYALGENDG